MHSDGRLFVEATGMLQLTQMPFLSYQNNLSMVSVAEGTKSLASNAFTAFTSMQYLKLPFTVTTIHEQAFANTNIDTILVLQGSKVDEFVTQKQMKHAYLGELTGDDVVDLADYDKMKKEIIGSGSPLSTEQKLLADCDGDGAIDAFDLALLKTCNIV